MIELRKHTLCMYIDPLCATDKKIGKFGVGGWQ